MLGLSLSEPGLWAAWNIVAKGTLGVLAAIVLASTTPVADLLLGLERLRVPRVLTSIAGFMVRYLDVIAGEAARMRIARASRGYDPRWLWQARAIAASAGTLFVRSYERGERVHLAMCSRGYAGVDARSPAARRRRRRGAGRPPCSRSQCRSVLVRRPGRLAVTGAAPPRACASPTPTGARRSTASTSRSGTGERVAVLGPNGAGKTTLVLHLNGILRAGRGEISVGDLPVNRANLAEIRRRVAIVFQDPDDQLFMPTVARRRRVRAGQPRAAPRATLDERVAREPAPPSAWTSTAPGRRTT